MLIKCHFSRHCWPDVSFVLIRNHFGLDTVDQWSHCSGVCWSEIILVWDDLIQAHVTTYNLICMLQQSQLQPVVDFAIKNGIPAAGEAGFWAHWIRFPDAPLYSNGTLSESNEDIRKNRTLFTSRFEGQRQMQMPGELWRNESQPGNTMDARDEKCTAQSRLGKQPEYLGLDDYESNGHQLHFAVCQSVGIPELS